MFRSYRCGILTTTCSICSTLFLSGAKEFNRANLRFQRLGIVSPKPRHGNSCFLAPVFGFDQRRGERGSCRSADTRYLAPFDTFQSIDHLADLGIGHRNASSTSIRLPTSSWLSSRSIPNRVRRSSLLSSAWISIWIP